MIAVRYLHPAKNQYSLTIQGHAGYSSQGNDIVCAGVSAIAYTLLGFLKKYEEDAAYISAHTQSGDVKVFCQGGEKFRLAYEMAAIGLQQIAKAYPDHVKVDIYPDLLGDSREQTAHDEGKTSKKGA